MITLRLVKNLIIAFTGVSLFAWTANARPANDYLILGVIASSEVQAGVALVKDTQSNRTFAIKVGQNLAENIKLTQVQRKHVEVLIGNQRHLINVGHKLTESRSIAAPQLSVANLGGGLERDGNTVRVSAIYRDHVIKENLGAILMQAAAVPYYNNERLAGFTLWEIEKDSIFESVGLQNGDTIISINQQDIRDVGSTIRTLNGLREENSAKFTYMRDGETHDIEIKVN